MKLRYIFATIIAALCFVGCQDETVLNHLENVQIEKSYISIPADGSAVSVEVTATQAWEFVGAPDWLKIEPAKGDAGTHKVSFSADANDNRDATITLVCGGEEQVVMVQQKNDVEPEVMTVTAALAALKAMDADVTVQMTVEGYIVSITEVSPSYGNATYYIADKASGSTTDEQLLVYRGYSLDGAKFEKEDEIAVGDFVKVTGPAVNYKGTTPEFTSGNKILERKASSLILESVTPAAGEVVAKEGGSIVAVLKSKTGVEVNIPEDAKSWISVGGMGVDGATVTITLNIAANEGGDREASVTFATPDGSGVAVTKVSQKGSIIEATAAEISAAADGTTIYRLTGYISEDTGSPYGNIYITDHSGKIYVYGVLNDKGESQKWAEMGISQGDIVTVEGVKTSYKDTPQMKNVKVTKHYAVADLTVADFLATAESKEVYYQIKGTVKEIEKEDYGNLTLQDATGEVYVYGVYTGWGGKSKQFASLGVKVGDELTIVGYHTSYNGKAQVGGGFYVAHKTPEAGGTTPPATDPNPGEPSTGGIACAKVDKIANLAAGTYYMAGYLATYENNGTAYDWTSYPYHVATATGTDI